MKTKTIYEIVQEHLNRLKVPEYEQIGVMSDDEQSFTFNDVRNLKNEHDENGKWLVFDSIYGGIDRHVRMKGWVVRYVKETGSAKTVKESIIHKRCKKIIIRLNTGVRETYENISNVTEDTYDGIVEFDILKGNDKVHVIKKRDCTVEHLEEIIE